MALVSLAAAPPCAPSEPTSDLGVTISISSTSKPQTVDCAISVSSADAVLGVSSSPAAMSKRGLAWLDFPQFVGHVLGEEAEEEAAVGHLRMVRPREDVLQPQFEQPVL